MRNRLLINKCLFCFSLLLVLSTNAPAASSTISYTPNSAWLMAPAGSQASISVNIEVLNSTAFMQYITLLAEINDGTLPGEWLSASPAGVFIRRGTFAATTLIVTVPPGTAPGVYTTSFISQAQASHQRPDPGDGFLISVEVPTACSDIAQIRVDGFGPSLLWPPNHSLNAVTVQGTVLLPAGCSLLEAAYRIDDEYGIFSASDTFTVAADGSFSIVLPVEASRKGQDKDGREYTVMVTVRNEAGTGSSEALKILVPHDQRRNDEKGY